MNWLHFPSTGFLGNKLDYAKHSLSEDGRTGYIMHSSNSVDKVEVVNWKLRRVVCQPLFSLREAKPVSGAIYEET